MLMTPASSFARFCGPSFPELIGRRVLIAGVTATHGLDLARTFAEHGARLIVQIDEASPETTAIGEVLAQTTSELSLHCGRLDGAEGVVAFARRAAAHYGGLDAVICLIPLTLPQAGRKSVDAVEQRLTDVLTPACLVARVAANRMRLMSIGGTILHIALLPKAPTAAEQAYAMAAKATLSAIVRKDAEAWARDGISVNAVAPEHHGRGGSGLAGEADIAALALHLVSGRGHALAGYTFEAEARP